MKIQQLSPGRLCLLFLVTFLPKFLPAEAAPSFVISTAKPSGRAKETSPTTTKTPTAVQIQRGKPYIDSFVIHSDIQYRYSRTKVQSVIVNPRASKSHEVTFDMTLPDTAFISKFSMTIGNNTYEAWVEKQAEAAAIYKNATDRGQSAGLVETRKANVFTVKSNVEASESITFTLTYEELLQRRFDVYEQAIHIDSEEVKGADTYVVIVTVTDGQDLKLLRAIGREDEDDNDEEIDNVKVSLDGNIGLMHWAPDTKAAAAIEIPKRIVLQYDIEHHSGAGQVLVRDGHFVHFFSPPTASVDPKHIIFVLDISGSMEGTKLEQLKEAMTFILKDLYANHKKDYFSIITFHSTVEVWTGPSARQAGQNTTAFPATKRNVQAATDFINSLEDLYMTNVHGALIAALTVAAAKASQQHKNADPLIMFLTDGDPTAGITDMDEIQSEVKAANEALQVPIFCLGFGNDVEFPFLRKLALQNRAVARKIYEASDAALQLENFYSEISSPALSNVNFTYTSDLYQVGNLTRTRFSRFFKGSEIIVAGKTEPIDPCQSYCVNGKFIAPANPTAASSSVGSNGTDAFGVVVNGKSAQGVKVLDKADVVLCDNSSSRSASEFYNVTHLFGQEENDSFMERLWAYLTIKQLLEQAEADEVTLSEDGTIVDEDNPAQRALDLALHYEFVTPLTSLVVLKRDDESYDKAALPSAQGYAKLAKVLVGERAVIKNVGDTTAGRLKCGVHQHLTVDEIVWLSADEDRIEMNINGSETFGVARENQTGIPIDGALCGSGGGTCTHLKDCVLEDFRYEFEVYMEDYFCKINASAGYPYAGVCCPASYKVRAATTATSAPHVEPPPEPVDDTSDYVPV